MDSRFQKFVAIMNKSVIDCFCTAEFIQEFIEYVCPDLAVGQPCPATILPRISHPIPPPLSNVVTITTLKQNLKVLKKNSFAHDNTC